MATKARQIYTADEQTLHKDKRTLEIESGYKTKIDGIEAGAEVNTIETIKVNGSEVEPDANRAVDLTIPNVIDNVSSVSSTDALSANMGRALAEEIQNLKAQGRFLSFWNAAAGRPTSEPPQELYTYHTGDYFIVNTVAVSGGTNYRPDGTTYTRGQISTTVETEAVVVGSEYVFDGTIWLMLAGGGGGGGSIIVDENLSTTSHNPVWNATITNALNTKEVLSNKVTSLANPSNTTYPTTQAVATELATKQNTLTAGTNIQINGNTISATDTTYTAGSGIAINNGVISNTRTSLAWGNITGTLSNQTDLNTALSDKQDVLTAGTGIDITDNVISSTVSSDITDVKVDGTSVVTNKVANIDLSGKLDVANPESTGLFYHKGNGTGYTGIIGKIQSNNGVATLSSDTSSALHVGGVPVTFDQTLGINGGILFSTAGQSLDFNGASLNNISGVTTRGASPKILLSSDFNAGQAVNNQNIVVTNTNIDMGTGAGNTWSFQTYAPGQGGTQERKAGIKANGDIIAQSYIKQGGTSSQFLKADGSVDSTSYATTTQLNNKQDTLTPGEGIDITNNTVSKKIFYVEVYASQIGLPDTTYADTVQAYQQGYGLIRRYNGTSSTGTYELTYISDSGAPSNPYTFYFSSDTPGEWYKFAPLGWSTVSAGGGDMQYSDFEFSQPTGNTITLTLSTEITPSANFTVNAPSTVKEGQAYILRVTNGATPYTMTLGTGIENPSEVDLTLTANAIDQFAFLGLSDGTLELQPGGSGSGDMKYKDFEFASKSGASVVLDLSSTITPTSNFTVNVPTEIKEGQIYVLRVTNGATSYTMTLGEGITNPRGTSLSLTANTTDQFVFYAVSNSVLELQAEGGGGGGPENIFVTQAEYDALTPEAGKTYFIYEEEN